MMFALIAAAFPPILYPSGEGVRRNYDTNFVLFFRVPSSKWLPVHLASGSYRKAQFISLAENSISPD